MHIKFALLAGSLLLALKTSKTDVVPVTIRGTVLAQDSTPITRTIDVDVPGTSFRTTAEAGGRFELPTDLSEGGWRVRMSAEGYEEEVRSLQVDSARAVDLGVIRLRVRPVPR